MKLKPAFYLGAFFLTSALSADRWDLSGWNVVDRQKIKATPVNLLVNGSFEDGVTAWNGIDGVRAKVDRSGINQTGGLYYERTDPADYLQVGQEVALKPGFHYRFGAMIRSEGVTGEGATLYIEGYDREGNYLGGSYPGGLTGDRDWTLVEGSFVAPKVEGATFSLGLYLRQKAVGKAWFDDVYLREVEPAWQLNLVYPTHHTAYPGQTLEFYTRIDGAGLEGRRNEVLFLRLKGEEEGKNFAMDESLLKFRPAKIPEGEFTVQAYWLDPDRREILNSQEIVIQGIPKPAALPDYAAVIDEHRRLQVGGEPYLPVGLYLLGATRQDIDIIADSPFNCIMPYGSPHLSFHGGYEDSTLDSVREVLDYCDEKGLKVIYSLKDIYDDFRPYWNPELEPDDTAALLVNTFKDHPAILAWYICDESAVEKIPAIAARRQMINRLDPLHPTWSVYYQVPDFKHYIPAQDVFGNDPYPINWWKDNHILGVDNSTREAEKLHMPLWAVPQIHNTGFYNPKWQEDPSEYFTVQRPPTETETMTMSLFEAMRGARGFIMYSYFDLNLGPDKLQFERRWPEVCRVAAKLQELGPYLLSTATAPEVKLTVRSGTAYARAFAAENGDLRVLIVSPGPGIVDAELEVGGKIANLVSERGRTYEKAPGVYRFYGENTCYDILRLE